MHGLYCISYFTLCISPGRVPRLHLQIYGAVNKCVCAFSCESYCILDNVHPVARVLIMFVLHTFFLTYTDMSSVTE